MPAKSKREFPRQNVIAMVYDFDGTLSPHNIQEDTIFKHYHLDKDRFWQRANKLVAEKGYERTLSYLKLLIQDKSFQKRPLSKRHLGAMASEIEYFPGVLKFFTHLKRFMRSVSEVNRWGITLEHYIISSGIKEILDQSAVAKHFTQIYACEFDYEKNRPVFPKLVINDTNKTQFLFRIKKGRLSLSEDINSHMPEVQCRVPFENMIYIGDGTTDIPSMTVVQRYGGHAIAVFPPDCEVPSTVQEMVRDERADHFAPADYREGKLLAKITQATLKKIIQSIAYRLSSRMSSDWLQRKGPLSPRKSVQKKTASVKMK